jgi:hypothetical protein
MRRLFIGERLSLSFKTLVDPAHFPFEKLSAALKIDYRASLVDQRVIQVSNGLLLEGYLGFKLDVNTFTVLKCHTVFPWNYLMSGLEIVPGVADRADWILTRLSDAGKRPRDWMKKKADSSG